MEQSGLETILSRKNLAKVLIFLQRWLRIMLHGRKNIGPQTICTKNNQKEPLKK